ncbi:MAG TPA: hypothetical protein VHK70_02640 [Burkholderiaceae bacterium]|nr:hypothetical protein [Burkholderiaceae bacterium]
MGIFSLFGKKDREETSTAVGKNASRKKRDEAFPYTSPGTDWTTETRDTADPHAAKRKVVAKATALKIDAIELEMSSEFVKTIASGHTLPGPVFQTDTTLNTRPKLGASTKPFANQPAASDAVSPSTLGTGSTIGATTQFLLNSETLGRVAALSVSESAPAIEEAAILFANDQIDMAEQVLQGAIKEDTLGQSAYTAWAMLFDLYQLTGKQAQFETLSIEFASRFEVSPPAWVASNAKVQAAPVSSGGVTPSVSFTGKLDGAIAKQLERVQNLAAKHHTLRLEFIHVTEVNPIGCGILLSVLKKLQKSGNDLVLVGTTELAAKIRSILQVGRRNETEAPWLLLLEILRLLNSEKEFEETSIDYCITFEVSPPAFVAPKNKVTTATATTVPKAGLERFTMPAVIEGKIDQLLGAIGTYTAAHNPAILDCTDLRRVDFSAAGQLMTGLVPLTGETAIELHNVNYLVVALFSAIGLKDIVRIVPRKA